jgi:acetyl-CoA C-acetyltransferase
MLSQARAAAAWQAGAYSVEVAPLDAPVPTNEVDRPTQHRLVNRDEGVRATTLEGLAALRPSVPGTRHTAGTTSQISDGAAAVLWMSRRRAAELGLRPRARLAHQVITGSDPYYLLDGPVVATRKLLARARMGLGDIDRYEINEAFAAVVLTWERVFDADRERLNANGGAIALGHPLGATGARLMVSALHELERSDAEYALVAACCGGALGTASLLQRL